MNSTLTINPVVNNAVSELETLLQSMCISNFAEINDKIEEIRKNLTEEDEATVVSLLMQMGEL